MKKNTSKRNRSHKPLNLEALAAIRGGSDLTSSGDDSDPTAATPILFTKCAQGR